MEYSRTFYNLDGEIEQLASDRYHYMYKRLSEHDWINKDGLRRIEIKHIVRPAGGDCGELLAALWGGRDGDAGLQGLLQPSGQGEQTFLVEHRDFALTLCWSLVP